MAGTRKRHPAAFKARVALEAAKQTKTVAELAKAYQAHPVRISQWKKQLLDGVETLFRDGRRREREEGLAVQAELYEKIGRLNMEIKWLKVPVYRVGLGNSVCMTLTMCPAPHRAGTGGGVWSNSKT